MKKILDDEFSKFNKGDVVKVTHSVYTKTKIHFGIETILVDPDPGFSWSSSKGEYPRRLTSVEFCVSELCLVVGRSRLITGIHRISHTSDNPGELLKQKIHRVLMVIPVNGVLYRTPFATLPEYCIHTGDMSNRSLVDVIVKKDKEIEELKRIIESNNR